MCKKMNKVILDMIAKNYTSRTVNVNLLTRNLEMRKASDI